MKTLEALVNPFGKLESESPDNIKKISSETDPEVEKCFKHLVENLPLYTPVLTPNQISLFVSKVVQLPETVSGLKEGAAGNYINILLLESYKAGHNGFAIDAGDKMLPFLASKFLARKEKFSIEYYGNLATLCANNSDGLLMHVHGNVGGHFASNAYDGEFHIHGDAGNYCGADADRCTFYFYGDAGSACGFNSYACEFRTTNPSTFEKLKKEVTAQHIDMTKDGNEEIYKFLKSQFLGTNWVILLNKP